MRGEEERDLSSGEFDPERPQDARVDRVGHYVARKLCSENTETGERTTREEEIHNELFPFVVIAGGTAGAARACREHGCPHAARTAVAVRVCKNHPKARGYDSIGG